MFCKSNDYLFPPNDTSALAEYLCNIADSSAKPRSKLKTTCAAVSCYYEASNLNNIVHDRDITRLQQALVKSSTSESLSHSKVMPVEKFNELFLSWGYNHQLSLKQLRQKAITLLALVTMLRPSDIAPKSVIFDPFLCAQSAITFNTDQILFENDGSMTITFFGIKNDSSRTGFQVMVPKASDVLLDPVQTIKDYLCRTKTVRSQVVSPVFLSLNSPYKALSAQSVGHVLEDSICDAGLDRKVYSAKSFRPTGATVAIDKGIHPKTVMKMGRWKTETVFFEHYVHSRTPCSYTDNVLK